MKCDADETLLGPLKPLANGCPHDFHRKTAQIELFLPFHHKVTQDEV